MKKQTYFSRNTTLIIIISLLELCVKLDIIYKCHIIMVCIILLAIPTNLLAQKIVTGSVKSQEDGKPLMGVSVSEQDSTNGIMTDSEGNFNIKVLLNSVLVFSHIGYETQSIIVNENVKKLQIFLVLDKTHLEELTVVGYGTQKKSDVTGSVTSVQVDELKNIPLARADEVLQGQVSGVQINNNDASPNGNITIRIRGVSSVSGGSDPLIIIDGVQGARMSEVNPNDIKSMEVLKDASATAIYGSRGASGVIIITTQQGRKKTKPSLSYNTYTSLLFLRKKIDLMNPSHYANYINQNRLANSLPVVFNQEQIAAINSGGGTDWQDAIFQTGISTSHHLNISGGTESIVYSLSGNYVKTNGIVLNSRYQKFSVRPNIAIYLSEKLKFNINSFFSLSEDNPIVINQRDREGSPIYASLRFAPSKPIYDDDGEYSQPGTVGPNTEYNPVALAKEPIRDNFDNGLILNPSIEYLIIKGLKANVSLSYQLYDFEGNYYYNEKVVKGKNEDRKASISDRKYMSLQNTNLLTYSIDFNDTHSLKITGLFEQQRIISKNNSTSSSNFITNEFSYNNLGSGKSPGIPYSNAEEQSLESFMGRINYSLFNKYLITATGRLDSSSVFAKNNKSAFFPSIALGWKVSKENFLKNVKVINSLKLRIGYGIVGNAAIKPYQSLSRLVSDQFSFSGGTINNGFKLSTQAPNDDLKWESTRQLNIGIDINILKNRLKIIAEYYRKNTIDLLFEKDLKQASGFQTQLVNAGEVENKGFEISITGMPISKPELQWYSTITFSNNKNEILSLNDDVNELNMNGNFFPGFNDSVWLQVGQPIGLIRGYQYNGVWKSNESVLAAAYGVAPGSPKYFDQNNDGQINSDDIINIANTLPDINFSWSNTISYKFLDFSVLIIGQQGNDIFNIARYTTEADVDGTSINLLNAWTPNNENTNVPGHKALGVQRNSSRWVEDGSYMRLKNITLGYSFPVSIANKLRISSLRIYVTGTNLYTLTNYSGFDPEANAAPNIASGTNTDSFRGIDLASYPAQKKITFGLNITF